MATPTISTMCWGTRYSLHNAAAVAVFIYCSRTMRTPTTSTSTMSQGASPIPYSCFYCCCNCVLLQYYDNHHSSSTSTTFQGTTPSPYCCCCICILLQDYENHHSSSTSTTYWGTTPSTYCCCICILLQDYENPDNININDVLGDYSLTLVDTLDTLAIIGNYSGTINQSINLPVNQPIYRYLFIHQ